MVAVGTDEYKLGTLEVSWNRYGTVHVRSKSQASVWYLVSQMLKLETGGTVGKWNSQGQWEWLLKPALMKNIPSPPWELSWFPKAPIAACLSNWGRLNRLAGPTSCGNGNAHQDRCTVGGRMWCDGVWCRTICEMDAQIFDVNCEGKSNMWLMLWHKWVWSYLRGELLLTW